MGGGQQYCSAKLKHLLARGFEVNVIHSFKGMVIIDNLKKFQNNYFPSLKYSPYMFSKRSVRKTCKRIEKVLGSLSQDDVIESSNYKMGEWAEIIASIYRCKHYCFYLDENTDLFGSDMTFLSFKFQQKQLFATSDHYYRAWFSGNAEVPAAPIFSPMCNDVVEDVNFDMNRLGFSKNDYIIGHLGRLDKPYFWPFFLDLLQYISNKPNLHFNLLFLGGSENNDVERQIAKRLKKVKNVRFFITGFICPIPRALLKSLNVCYGTAGSSIVSCSERVPTIYLNCVSGKTIGILNVTVNTQKGDLRYSNSVVDFGETLDMALFGQISDAVVQGETLKNDSSNADSVSKEIDYELDLVKNRQDIYFDVFKSLTLRGTKSRLLRFLGVCFGYRMLDFVIFSLYHRIRRKKDA